MKKVLMSLLVACTLMVSTMSTTGCWGSFAITKKLYNWNDKTFSNKFVKWVVFLIGGSIVGGLGFVFDILIFNSVEFWTGSKLISAGDTYYETDANGNSVTAVKMEDGSLYMRLDAANGESHELVLQKDEEMVRILDAKGSLLKEAELAELSE